MESHSSEEEKSKNEEDDYEDESIYIKIKKEKPSMIYLEKKIYEKIISQIEKYNDIIKEIKTKSFTPQNNLGLIIDNTKDDKFEKKLQDKEKIINELRIQIEIKEKEIISLKSQNDEINKKYNEIKKKYDKEIEEKNIIINSIKEDLNNINNKYNDLNEKINNEKKNEDKTIILIKLLTNEKISDNISNYLTLEEKLKLFSVNKAINFSLKYKNRYNELQKKYSESQNLIAHLTSEDILKKYEIFLEKIIRKPLRELNFETLGSKGVISNKEKISQTAKGIFNNILSVVSKREDIEMKKLIKENLQQKLIEMNYEVYYNIQKKKEIEFKEKINSDQLINIKFEYNSAEEIKYLIRHFLKVGLSENYYTQFKSYLIDEFAELLFNSYKSLECIKELEICNKIQGIRFNKNIYLIKQMTNEINALNKLKEANKQSNNKLIQQKNELEIKYNDSLLMISSTNKQLLEANTQIEKLLEEKNKSEEQLQIFKNKIMNEYKIIEDKYNKVNEERKSFINIFLEMKIFFINQIELLNKQDNIMN